MKIITTPFDNLIVHLAQNAFGNPMRKNSFRSLVQRQLDLLRVIYMEMHQVDFYEKTMKMSTKGETSIPVAKYVLTHTIDMNKAILDYQSFLFAINQFGRALGAKHKLGLSRFPKFYEIKFYRDKVAEHWDEYIKAVIPNGMTFQKGKAGIPVVGRTIQPAKRGKVAKDLEKVFQKLGVAVSIPKKYISVSMISTNPEYVKFMFSSLKKVNSRLIFKRKEENILHFKLISLLFDFGFPSPILDVQDYSEQLAKYLIKISQRRI